MPDLLEDSLCADCNHNSDGIIPAPICRSVCTALVQEAKSVESVTRSRAFSVIKTGLL
jgi:hypothetical protein